MLADSSCSLCVTAKPVLYTHLCQYSSNNGISWHSQRTDIFWSFSALQTLNFPLVMQTYTLSLTGAIQSNRSNTEVTVFHQGVLQCEDGLGFWLRNNRVESILKGKKTKTPANSWCQFFLKLLKGIYWACNNELIAVQDIVIRCFNGRSSPVVPHAGSQSEP